MGMQGVDQWQDKLRERAERKQDAADDDDEEIDT